MDQLIEALLILRKYSNPDYPTQCEHDVMSIMINPDDVSKEDITKSEDIGFFANEGYFYSYVFGSA